MWERGTKGESEGGRRVGEEQREEVSLCWRNSGEFLKGKGKEDYRIDERGRGRLGGRDEGVKERGKKRKKKQEGERKGRKNGRK